MGAVALVPVPRGGVYGLCMAGSIAGAVFASQMAYVVTVSAILLSALLLSEIYSAWVWSALALMMAGLTLVQPRGARQPEPEISG